MGSCLQGCKPFLFGGVAELNNMAANLADAGVLDRLGQLGVQHFVRQGNWPVGEADIRRPTTGRWRRRWATRRRRTSTRHRVVGGGSPAAGNEVAADLNTTSSSGRREAAAADDDLAAVRDLCADAEQPSLPDPSSLERRPRPHLPRPPPEQLKLPCRRKRHGEHVVLPGGPPCALRQEEAVHVDREVLDDDGLSAGIRERAFADHRKEGLHGGAMRLGWNGSEGVEGGGVVTRGGKEAEARERRQG
uniref:Uncharacterized protein n=1 Tax=Oryza rufipogon TaxID=4529 RepID=A0A0E0N674_ORYRU